MVFFRDSAEEPTLARKPDPNTSLMIPEQLGVRPESCLFVGDSEVDMKTAVAAGMFPVGALWGFRTREELEQNGARALIAKPTDLLDLIS